ncbi:glycosyltransferase family protein [Streptomyces ureilyticus]|uniref:hypothetical protein n=1 Tax=Streptomyces ureilyticus TaxID=1775131 RepID=UPI0019CF4FD6|nr:hypothetical protein [Streptomyces ureilyticus]
MKSQVPYGSSGTRLRLLSDTSPDRLIPAAGRPVLVHVPKNQREPGAEEIGVIVGARREATETAPGDYGSASGARITCIPQEAPLGLSESAAGPAVRRLRLGSGRPVVRDSRVARRTAIGAGCVVEAAGSGDSILRPGAGVRRIGGVRGSVLARESAAGQAVRRLRLGSGRPVVRDSRVARRTAIGAGCVVEAAGSGDSILRPGAGVRRIGGVCGSVLARGSAAGQSARRLRLAAGRPAWVRAVVARTVVPKAVDRRALGVVGTDPEGRVTWGVEESRDPAASPLRLAVGRPVWSGAAA